MTMGLLAPLFLAGLLVIALPVWLHRLQTKSTVRESFSSAMFLKSAEHHVHVQRRLKYLLLLALRIILLLLLALAFAQPFWSRPPAVIASASDGTHLVVVDTSVSMGRTDMFPRALTEARSAIAAVPDGALLQLLSADDGLRVVSELSANRNDTLTSLSALTISAFRLDLGRLVAELDRYVETLPPPVTLHFVSDYQASGMPLRFAEMVSSNISTLTPWPVVADSGPNWSVEFVRESAGGLNIGIRTDDNLEQTADVQVLVNDELHATQSVAASGRHSLQFDDVAFIEGDNRIEVRIVADDVLPTDNRRYSIVENDPPVPVPLITRRADGLAVTYLTAALESAADGAYQVTPMAVSEFDPRVLSRYGWIVSDDIGSLSATASDAISEYISAGGNMLAFSGDFSLPVETLPVSGHQLQAASLEGGNETFLSIGQVDTQHPSLAAAEGWHRVNVSRTLPVVLTDEDQVLVRLENNDPLVLERRIGAGRLLLVLSSADAVWNDLPLHPVFVSFALEAAAYLGGGDRIPASFTAGASLPLSLTGSASGQVVDPDGQRVLSLADTAQAQQIKLDKSGVYEVYTPQGEMLVAVNLDARESEFEPIAGDVLTRWQDATGRQDDMAADTRSMLAETPPLELWHWLLLLLALFVIGESVLGNRYLASTYGPT